MASKFRVTIDQDECILCGACWSECGEVFEESDQDDSTQIVEKYRTSDDLGVGLVPEEMEECVRNAADICPVEIIHVEEA